MVGHIDAVGESNNRNPEQVADSDVQRVKQFKEELKNLSPDEQIKIAHEFDKGVNKYMDPELKAIVTWNTAEIEDESADVTEKDKDNLKILEKLNWALDDYPDISKPQKKAIEDIVYGPVDRAEKKIENILEQNEQKEKSDKNIERVN